MGPRINWMENANYGDDAEFVGRQHTAGYNPCITFADDRVPLNIDQSLVYQPYSACSWGNLQVRSAMKESGQPEDVWCCLAIEDQEEQTFGMELFGDGICHTDDNFDATRDFDIESVSKAELDNIQGKVDRLALAYGYMDMPEILHESTTEGPARERKALVNAESRKFNMWPDGYAYDEDTAMQQKPRSKEDVATVEACNDLCMDTATNGHAWACRFASYSPTLKTCILFGMSYEKDGEDFMSGYEEESCQLAPRTSNGTDITRDWVTYSKRDVSTCDCSGQ